MRTVRSSSRRLGGLPRGGVSQHALEQNPPLWTEWLTDRCKNITFPQIRLRTVNIGLASHSLGEILNPPLVYFFPIIG